MLRKKKILYYVINHNKLQNCNNQRQIIEFLRIGDNQS